MIVYWVHYYISFQLFLVQIALSSDATSKLKIYFTVSLSFGDGLSSNHSLLYSSKMPNIKATYKHSCYINFYEKRCRGSLNLI